MTANRKHLLWSHQWWWCQECNMLTRFHQTQPYSNSLLQHVDAYAWALRCNIQNHCCEIDCYFSLTAIKKAGQAQGNPKQWSHQLLTVLLKIVQFMVSKLAASIITISPLRHNEALSKQKLKHYSAVFTLEIEGLTKEDQWILVNYLWLVVKKIGSVDKKW